MPANVLSAVVVQDAIAANGEREDAAWESAGAIATAHVHRCLAIDSHQDWNRALLLWMILGSWSRFTAMFCADDKDEFGAASNLSLPSGTPYNTTCHQLDTAAFMSLCKRGSLLN